MLKFFDHIKLDETLSQADVLLDEIHDALFKIKMVDNDGLDTTYSNLILNPIGTMKSCGIKPIKDKVVAAYNRLLAIRDCRSMATLASTSPEK